MTVTASQNSINCGKIRVEKCILLEILVSEATEVVFLGAL